MLCDNCGKREANVRYSENINGKKKELNLCEECSRKLGVGKMDFSMPIDFSSFFGGLVEDFMTPEFMPLFDDVKSLKCDECGYTFDDIVNTGKLGCANCYSTFEERLDPIIKKIQGSNMHVGRTGKIIDDKIGKKFNIENNTNDENESKEKSKKEEKTHNENNDKNSKLSKLKEDLKSAIKDERYEDAAKLRDEIKKIEDNK